MGNQHDKYMQSTIKLAKRGVGSVEPNPAVGCIIVKNDKVIGKGWHKKFGGPHAEINALEDCKKRGANPKAATMYVTLEPCCHLGKTPACTDVIIATGLAKVVVAMLDPSEHANGKGIMKLQNAGIEVQTGICRNQARLLNAPFIKFAATGKCWIILKWAQTTDGKMAWLDNNKQRWISGEQSRKDVHKLRQRVQGILVGVKTVLVDDPLLTARPSKGKKLTRIVLDSQLRIPLGCKLLTTAKKTPLLIVTSKEAIRKNPQLVEKIIKKQAEILAVPATQDGCDVAFLVDQLGKRGIRQLLVEGGPTVITSFLKQQIADESIIYISPKILAAQGSIDISEPMAELTQAIGLHHVEIKRFGDDVRLAGLLKET